MKSTNTTSRYITIFRAGSFLSRAQGAQIDDYFATSKKAIGAYYDKLTRKAGSGLTREELAILMPGIVDYLPTDREYSKAVDNFFNDMHTDVPHGTGRMLEIGLTLDNDAPLHVDNEDPSKSNLPLEAMDYIRYRHALTHPLVAISKELADSDQIKEFYVFDKDAAANKLKNLNKQKDDAMKVYLDIKDDQDKVEQMLVLMGVDTRKFSGATRANQMQTELRESINKKAEQFLATAASPTLESEYLLAKLVGLKLVSNLAGRYVDDETKKLLGNSKEETIYWLADELNSDIVLAYKARIQEKLR